MPDRPIDLPGDDELAELRAIGRRVGIDADHPVDALEAPPAELWDRIAADVLADRLTSAAADLLDRRVRELLGRAGAPIQVPAQN